MSATDKLRELLDKLGIKWDYGITGTRSTEFATVGGVRLSFMAMRGGLECTTILTPEQVIEATLGRGTCKPTTYDNYLTKRLKPGEYYEFWEPACACSECGELIPMRRFCPNCGARIEVDE